MGTPNEAQGSSHIKEIAAAARVAAQCLQKAATAERCAALEGYRRGLLKFRDEIEKANAEDLQAAAASVASGELAESLYQRLDCRGSKFASLLVGLEQLMARTPDPVGRCDMATELCENLHLYRVTCPIGVLAVIYEARPEAAVQIAGLALKSGNALVLKGGKEASRTNKAIFRALRWGLRHCGENEVLNCETKQITKSDTSTIGRCGKSEQHSKQTEADEEGADTAEDTQSEEDEAGVCLPNIPIDCLQMIEGRHEVAELLALDEYIDLVIPRGSKSLVQYVKCHTKIPVMGHADGLCSLYVDAAADVEKAVRIILDSKLQYPSACNAIETLLVHDKIAAKLLPTLAKTPAATALEFKADVKALPLLLSGSAGEGEVRKVAVETNGKAGTSVREETGGAEDRGAPPPGGETNGEEKHMPQRVTAASDVDFVTEWLAPVLSVKIVSGLQEAVDHINTYGSHHTDCIVTKDSDVAEAFLRSVDSAGVYHNCSTRFADGYRYGFGAEVGISTNRVHARGPVGVEGLLTYKYRLYGKGHTVDDVAKGRIKYTHKNMKSAREANKCGCELESVEDVARRQRYL